MEVTLNAFSQRVKRDVDARLAQALDQLAGSGAQLKAAMHYSLTNGGKRVRPLLVYASAQAIRPGMQEGLEWIAAALESIHAYSLVHDDLPAMDDDDLRRGKPTTHIAFDEASAILAGDALQAFAFELLALAPLAAELKVQLITHLARASGAQGMVLGQAIDLAAVNQQLDLQQLERMHRHKTGALISAAVTMGALAAGANAEQCLALEHYAEAIGLAFQVQDDILDVTSDTETLGKQQGADSSHNKPTYVSLLGLDGAKAKAQALHSDAHQALAQLGPAADTLRQLADYIVERKA
ncbi:polyprenyl synthetase family protein [Simiduia curdlanivorans]|uniref:Polyprenyl synthetase family protein n=1 Tax=Simiduia curdlanivorans TaxID=1492769 RepID=A0ABV8V138_9GAMM|nr:farnesyl diphosphate synthase [Simiduia curdlanivorans]MDN3637594.1 polyprenyl synthetase family protein [Simiduia curdlanivorans]